MTIDLKIDGPDNWANILWSKQIGSVDGQLGNRLPSIILTPDGRLEVSASFSGIWNWYWNTEIIRGIGWFTLNLRHYNGKFQIYIDNVLKHEYINTMPQDWDNVELALGFGSAAVAEFKNFVFQGFGK